MTDSISNKPIPSPQDVNFEDLNQAINELEDKEFDVEKQEETLHMVTTLKSNQLSPELSTKLDELSKQLVKYGDVLVKAKIDSKGSDYPILGRINTFVRRIFLRKKMSDIMQLAQKEMEQKPKAQLVSPKTVELTHNGITSDLSSKRRAAFLAEQVDHVNKESGYNPIEITLHEIEANLAGVKKIFEKSPQSLGPTELQKVKEYSEVLKRELEKLKLPTEHQLSIHADNLLTSLNWAVSHSIDDSDVVEIDKAIAQLEQDVLSAEIEYEQSRKEL